MRGLRNRIKADARRITAGEDAPTAQFVGAASVPTSRQRRDGMKTLALA